MWWGMKWFLLPPSTPLLLAIPSPKVTDQTKTENRTIFSYCIFACFIYTSTRRSQHHQERQQADCFIPLIVWFLRIGYFSSCTTWKDMGLFIFFFHIPVIHCYMAIYELFYYFLFIFFFEKNPQHSSWLFLLFFFVTSTHIPCSITLNQMDHVIDQLGWDEVHFFICNAVVNIKCFLPLFHSSSEATTWMSKKVLM